MSSDTQSIESRRRLANILGLAILALLALLAVAPLAHIIYTVIVNGANVIAKVGLFDFLTSPPRPQNPQNPGGIGPVLLGSAMLIALASAIGVSLALVAGVFVAEFRRAGISRLVLILSLLLVEFPTILVGLYIYATIVQPMGTYSMLAGALALSLVMMPYVAVQVSEALRGVPQDLREAAFSLGISRLKAVYRIILGIARRGILVGILIGVAKVAGETAPLLFTIGGAFNKPPTSLTEPGGAVPLLIYEFIQQPGPGYHELAWGASLILLTIVFSIMVIARLLVKGVRL
ncbi:phosphate ABC transporter permease PstA [Pyrodictium delaneyi]|uniref:phosphate ABC transporter permease PstA n=1 Tax=Pyrodictium delaneyi TaxID=1273541 RepID=UPI001C5B934E|nr:phosphate ABC transporter permease PstA [Pyrodictium delaneyi]